MRYSALYNCKNCEAQATPEYVSAGGECIKCGGRIWVRTHRHHGSVTVDGERFMEARDHLKKVLDSKW